MILPDSISEIGSYSFSGNAISNVTLSNSLKRISEGSFTLNLLTSVTIPESINAIGIGAFSTNQLNFVKIPSSVKTIEYLAFDQNPDLQTVQFMGRTKLLAPDAVRPSVTFFGEGTFYNLKTEDEQDFLPGLTVSAGVYTRKFITFTFYNDDYTEPAGSSSVRKQYYEMEEQVTAAYFPTKLRKNTFVRPMYKFIGWNDGYYNRDMGFFYEDEEEVTAPESLELYATWKPLFEDDDPETLEELYDHLVNDLKLKNVKKENLEDYQFQLYYLTFLYYEFGQTNGFFQEAVDAVNADDVLLTGFLTHGWNLISSPFPGWSPSMIETDAPMFLFSYDSEANAYSYEELNTKLIPGKGYWLYVHMPEAMIYNDLRNGDPEMLVYPLAGKFSEEKPEFPLGWSLFGFTHPQQFLPYLSEGEPEPEYDFDINAITFMWDSSDQSYSEFIYFEKSYNQPNGPINDPAIDSELLYQNRDPQQDLYFYFMINDYFTNGYWMFRVPDDQPID